MAYDRVRAGTISIDIPSDKLDLILGYIIMIYDSPAFMLSLFKFYHRPQWDNIYYFKFAPTGNIPYVLQTFIYGTPVNLFEKEEVESPIRIELLLFVFSF